MRHALLTLSLAGLWLGACGSERGSEAGFATSCDGAALDADEVCRTSDGRFAEASCCERSGGDEPSISEGVAALNELFPDGRGDSQNVTATVPLEMIKEYLIKHHEDEEVVAGYTLVEDSEAMLVDEHVAGTLKPEAARARVSGMIEWVYEHVLEGDAEAMAQKRAEAEAVVDDLIEAGAIFGFDGYDQNGCAAPTPMLLVLDREHGAVDAIDLAPCME
ncbi:MAG TPA: hypothetical protein VFB62_13420 [Polyangiaceae bacterium]|jgi:hypothetical protein|nr:hypothetical protein [Polyangiaceae bacterium]